MDEILRLFHQYKDAVYRLALSLTGSPADAEDVTQTVFLKLMENSRNWSRERSGPGCFR